MAKLDTITDMNAISRKAVDKIGVEVEEAQPKKNITIIF